MSIKVISWNVNGFRSVMRKGVLQDLVEQESPDILFLQEIKCPESQFVEYDLSGYEYFVNSGNVEGRHGTAICVKEELLADIQVFAVDPLVDGNYEGRLQAMVVDGILFLNSYTVNIRDGLTRAVQRQEYDLAIKSFLRQWYDVGNSSAILIGDLNVVSQPIDYHGMRIDSNRAGMSDQERNSFLEFLDQYGLNDSFRHLHPSALKYSFWTNYGNARDRNKGWRLDYALASTDLLNRIETSDILTNVVGSDHAPIIFTIK